MRRVNARQTMAPHLPSRGCWRIRNSGTKKPEARSHRDYREVDARMPTAVTCANLSASYLLPSGLYRRPRSFTGSCACVSRALAGFTAGQDLLAITRRTHQTPKVMCKYGTTIPASLQQDGRASCLNAGLNADRVLDPVKESLAFRLRRHFLAQARAKLLEEVFLLPA